MRSGRCERRNARARKRKAVLCVGRVTVTSAGGAHSLVNALHERAGLEWNFYTHRGEAPPRLRRARQCLAVATERPQKRGLCVPPAGSDGDPHPGRPDTHRKRSTCPCSDAHPTLRPGSVSTWRPPRSPPVTFSRGETTPSLWGLLLPLLTLANGPTTWGRVAPSPATCRSSQPCSQNVLASRSVLTNGTCISLNQRTAS